MALWQEENRIPALQEARTYLDAHQESDDPDAWALCVHVVDAADGPAAPTESGPTAELPSVKPSEEQLEEDGAD